MAHLCQNYNAKSALKVSKTVAAAFLARFLCLFLERIVVGLIGESLFVQLLRGVGPR